MNDVTCRIRLRVSYQFACDRSVFFFNDTATTDIYTLSLHDALPIYLSPAPVSTTARALSSCLRSSITTARDRKSTRLNSSHSQISYAVFCLKKKKVVEPEELKERITKTVSSLAYTDQSG